MLEFINKAEIQGYVGNARMANNVLSFTMNTQHGSQVGECRTITIEWFNIRTSSKEAIEAFNEGRLGKGAIAHVSGRLHVDLYRDAQGNGRSSTAILAETVEIVRDAYKVPSL